MESGVITQLSAECRNSFAVIIIFIEKTRDGCSLSRPGRLPSNQDIVVFLTYHFGTPGYDALNQDGTCQTVTYGQRDH